MSVKCWIFQALNPYKIEMLQAQHLHMIQQSAGPVVSRLWVILLYDELPLRPSGCTNPGQEGMTWRWCSRKIWHRDML